MDVAQALKVFNIYGQEINRKVVKDTYRKLCSKYHPDKNPNGLRVMQDINVAYDYLSSVSDSLLEAFSTKPKRKKESFKSDDLDWFRRRGLFIYDDGDKIYIEGSTFPYRDELKNHHFRWNPDERNWWRYL